MSDGSLENDEKGPNRRQLLAILEKNGLKVHEPNVRDQLPVTINHEGFQGLQSVGVQALENLVDRCKSYLSGVLVEDNFGDTFEGRQKRQNLWSELGKKYGEAVADIQKRDKLKMGSSVGTIKAYFDWLVTELDAASVRSSKADGVREFYQKFLATIPFTERDGQMTMKEEYTRMKFQEKATVVGEIDAVLREFLDFVAPKDV